MTFGGERVLALIPARGGSVRLPGKNLEQIGGRTLVEIAVRSGLAVANVDEVVVSSDSPEILADGLRAGATVEKREPALALSETTSREVIDDVLSRRPDVDVLILLQPTSPLRAPRDVTACLETLLRHPTAATVTTTDYPSAWTRTISPEGHLLPGGELIDERTAAVLMPRSRSIDVDDAFDLHLARLLAASPFKDDRVGDPS
jgi:N-acylneuraminate cytidylyltransferase